MGNKESRSNSGYYYDSRSYDSRSFRSSSDRSSFSENYHDHERKGVVQSKYSKIGDDYSSLEQVTNALAQAGLESSNLIVGIDFTKSNEWTGARSFNRKSLHHLGHTPNPYEQAISIIGRTLSSFDEDNLIPCFGFGDGQYLRMLLLEVTLTERVANYWMVGIPLVLQLHHATDIF
ncbi:E3 ubiquitin-protein ligase RGLG2-like [Rhodamnia argentea]|uniref:E3 ubiquitin-protein ligase RGLG2-like n=1 Tax=Rhodamnia argentea TaxID=178133 RepID=A0ABM3HW47_9MYRT|nr:E3 ubiquitin-protein ligase RGLG2-like [Rhodamnia argentea]XP_048140820.1 E3 ubiquitin-protein ligase RGLG2-like [Rhodamnia argentea]